MAGKNPRGRPRIAPSGGTVEVDTLALFLQELMRSAGMTVSRLCASFTEDQFRSAGDTPGRIPSRATGARRLNGVGLRGQRALVDAIVTNCTTPETRPAQQRKAAHLFRNASQRATPVDQRSRHQDELTNLRKEMTRLRFRLANRNALYESLNARVLELSLLVVNQAQAPDVAESREEAFHQVLQRSEDARRQAERTAESLRQRLRTFERTDPEGADDLATSIRDLDPEGSRFAAALRTAIDAQLDGLHTGRFRWDQLSRAERVSFPGRVRSWIGREFEFADGTTLDFELDGVEFDCLFSTSKEWLIPPEVVGQLCLLVFADDQRSQWSIGVVRIAPEMLGSANRDGKKRLTRQGREAVHWIHDNAPLPPNLLLQLPDDQVEAIFTPRGAAARVAELFRRVQGVQIDSTTLETVTMTENFHRRVRDALPVLRTGGVLVLNASMGHIARDLGLPVPDNGQLVSVRVTPATDDDTALTTTIDGQRWRLAYESDPVVTAPRP